MTVIHDQNPHAGNLGTARSLSGVDAGLGAGWLALAIIAALVGGGISAFAGMGRCLLVLSGRRCSRPILC